MDLCRRRPQRVTRPGSVSSHHSTATLHMNSLWSLRALSRSRLTLASFTRPHASSHQRPLEKILRSSPCSSTTARGFHFKSRFNVSQRPTYTRFGSSGSSSGWNFLARYDPMTVRIGVVVVGGSGESIHSDFDIPLISTVFESCTMCITWKESRKPADCGS